MSQGHRLGDLGNELSPSGHPEDAILPGFDLAESIWSQDSDLTLDDVALESDSDSSQTRSSASAHWSTALATPPISRPLRLPPPLEPAAPAPAFTPSPVPTPEPSPLLVDTPAPKPVSKEPESPAPAYSRNPLEFDPALLASLDSQLLLNPFDAFEDLCWACLSDDLPSIPRTQLPRRQILPSPYSPSPVVMTFESYRPLGSSSFSPVSPNDTAVQFFPVRAATRARSKSVGGTRVRRLASAISRLRGRD
ncbi:hypothetical protein BGW80DRAFT_1297760 [Lactifluus volemus]|nr:hypothetical protein BGW80DRAFT_1297760 [Lactifluus volemus]